MKDGFVMDYSRFIQPAENVSEGRIENEDRSNPDRRYSITQEKNGGIQNFNIANYPAYMSGYQLVPTNNVYEDMLQRERLLQKADFAEAERERRKAQMDMLELDEDGSLSMRTINTRKNYPASPAANFTEPRLTILRHDDERVYLISLCIGKQRKQIYVGEDSAGDGRILLKKLNSIGADFLVQKMTRKRNAAEQMLSILLRKNPEEFEIPALPGWYKDKEGNMNFWREEYLTWKNIKKII